MSELRLHLYLNAFRNTKSTWIKEAGAKAAKKAFKKDGWGFIEVDRVALAGGEDLTQRMEFIHPDDDNADDKTVIRVPLPRPVGPGASVAVEIDFTARMPSPPLARTGSLKEFFFVAQWFPKVGVFENGQWNCHQFHAKGEFYADFGVYDVKLTVPAENVVGATGVEVERVDHGDGTATHYYHAEDVHDFAWTTSPNFVEFVGREQDVEIRLLMHKEHKSQAERHLTAAKHAVRYYQDWYGDYPYPNLTVVDPKRKAGGAGGMEYPTLITAGTMIGMPKGAHAVEMVIIHEFGHNFFYGMVASNEFEEA
ncbi:MAG: M1 family metallopeptidase, partial [bacterium]|nr:M1 family metallopeptidase [bacterium]